MNGSDEIRPVSPGAGAGRRIPVAARPAVAILWRRTAAGVIDLAIVGTVIVGIATAVGSVLSGGSGTLPVPVGLVLMVLPVLYDAMQVGGPQRATFGHRMFGVVVVTNDGERSDRTQAAIWSLVFYAATLMSYGLVLAMPLFDPRRRTVQDFLTGMRVVGSAKKIDVSPARSAR